MAAFLGQRMDGIEAAISGRTAVGEKESLPVTAGQKQLLRGLGMSLVLHRKGEVPACSLLALTILVALTGEDLSFSHP
jgi:hypothetical protein